MQEKFIKEIGRCITGFNVITRGNFLLIDGHFSYESCGEQGIGWIIDQEFIMSFLSAFGVSSFKETKGKLVYVTHSYDTISRIDPIFKEDGTPFDIMAWRDKRRKISDQSDEYINALKEADKQSYEYIKKLFKQYPFFYKND